MKPKTLILMGLAITCGLGASYMTSQLLADRQPQEDQKITLLVAKRSLSIGDAVKKPEDLFEPKQFVVGQEPKDAISEKDLESLKGNVMKVSLRKGDHVTANDLSRDGGLQIPEGHYAMGFPVNAVTGASGFATLPLSRVDILLTMKRGSDRDSKAMVLLTNVLVLAADIKVGRDDGLAAPASVVTFALKPEEALKVQLAQKMGELTLALRKPNDNSMMHTPSVSGENVLNNKKVEDDPIPEPAPPKPSVVEKEPTPPQVVEAPKGTLHELTIYNGGNVRRHSARIGDDGKILDENTLESGPTPPRATQGEAPQKKRGPTDI